MRGRGSGYKGRGSGFHGDGSEEGDRNDGGSEGVEGVVSIMGKGL